MTGFGIYLVVVMLVGIAGNLYYAGKGGHTSSTGVLLFGALWAFLNLLGVVFLGTGLGLY